MLLGSPTSHTPPVSLLCTYMLVLYNDKDHIKLMYNNTNIPHEEGINKADLDTKNPNPDTTPMPLS